MLPTDGGSEHATEAFIGPNGVFLFVLYLFIFGKSGRKNMPPIFVISPVTG